MPRHRLNLPGEMYSLRFCLSVSLSEIQVVTEKGIEFIQKALLPRYTDAQASAEFTR